ncbi:TPA: hypothetical protein ACGRN1_001883 [Pseudomonas aeruginosa]
MSKELNKALELLREIRPSIPKDVLELWCKDRDAFLASHKATVEQAGGDERAAFEAWLAQAMSKKFEPEFDLAKYEDSGEYRYSPAAAYWKAWQARAALTQPSLMPPDRGPWHAVKWDGGRRVDLSSDDFEHDVALTVSGDFVEGDKFRYAQELAAWMNAHLAQPSPVQAEQHWPKLEKPAQVGGVRFSAGVSSRLVVEAAQRLYEFESTPEQEAERIERLQAFREQCFEPLGTEFSKVLSDNLPELLSTAQAEQAEAERPEVVATMYTHHDDVDFREFVVVGNCDKGCEGFYGPEKLMTVAQHERIAASRLERAMDLMGEHVARISDKLTAERDAALAEVERLRQFERICEGLPQDAIDGGWTVQGIRGYAKRLEDQLKVALARVAELERKLRDEENAHTTTIEQRDNAEHWADQLAKAIAERFGVDIGEHSNLNCPWNEALVWMQQPPAQAQHSVPGKYDDVLLPFSKLMEHELHANAGKGDRPGWLQMDRKTALLEIYYHLGKLQKATRDNDPAGIVEYAADVANMSMMLVDVCGLLAAAPAQGGE